MSVRNAISYRCSWSAVARRGARLAGVALVSLALAGCSSASPGPQSAPASSPTPGSPVAAPNVPQTMPAGTPVSALETGAPTPAPIQEFAIRDGEFSPKTVTIPAGTIGLWTNHDGEEHTIVGPGWELGPIGSGQAWAHTFKANEVGTVTYHSKAHPDMTGTVIVTP